MTTVPTSVPRHLIPEVSTVDADELEARTAAAIRDAQQAQRSERRFTYDEVDYLSNGDVAVEFSRADHQGDTFIVTIVSTPPDNILDRQSYVDEGDKAFVADIDEIDDIYRAGGWTAMPPLIADRNGNIFDGAHRLAAALEAGLDLTQVPAFTLNRPSESAA